jgi:hypothetical protein
MALKLETVRGCVTVGPSPVTVFLQEAIPSAIAPTTIIFVNSFIFVVVLLLYFLTGNYYHDTKLYRRPGCMDHNYTNPLIFSTKSARQVVFDFCKRKHRQPG